MANGKDPSVNGTYSTKQSIVELMEIVCEVLEIQNQSSFISDAIVQHALTLASQNPILRRQIIKHLRGSLDTD